MSAEIKRHNLNQRPTNLVIRGDFEAGAAQPRNDHLIAHPALWPCPERWIVEDRPELHQRRCARQVLEHNAELQANRHLVVDDDALASRYVGVGDDARQRWLGLSAQPRGLVKWIAGRLIMPLREAAG
jgi:hypothetical protein